MTDWSPGSYSRPSDPDTWDAVRLLENVLIAIGAASAANFGFRDDSLLLEGLDISDQYLPYLYRIGGTYSLATTLLELHCEETGQSALEVLQHLGLKANQSLAVHQVHAAGHTHPSQQPPAHQPQNPDEDPPPPLEPV